jgi:hypothetical protein
MQIEIYHRAELYTRRGINFEELGDSIFEHVATITIPPTLTRDNLEYSFRWTNNVTGSWSISEPFFEDGDRNGDFNPSVKVLAPLHEHNGLRSTSVGDLMFVDGTMYVVDSIGFSEI